MLETWQSFDTLLQSLWLIALLSSGIFLVQAMLTFLGTDAGDGLQADFDGDLNGGDTHFQLFSFRNLINFMLGFSWTAISFYHTFESAAPLTILSLSVGCLFVAFFYIIIRQLQKLAEDNSFKLEKTIGKSAEVYLTIPARKTGKGKIQISVNGSIRELDAVTEHEKLDSGRLVKVLKIENEKLLLVEPL